jgi:hypothetical protein
MCKRIETCAQDKGNIGSKRRGGWAHKGLGGIVFEFV